MKTLIELYSSILPSVGMIADNQGFVSTLSPGSDTPKPFSVNSKRLVLPTTEQLQQADWSNRVGFHPLLQNLTGGESPVMEKFRERMNAYADFMFGMLLTDISQLAVKKELHKDLSPTQASYLGPFSDGDEKFIKLLRDLTATKRVSKKNYEFLRFSVIKGRVWQGQKRSRVAVLHFPLYEALPKDNKPGVILGQKLRVADVKMLRNMYEFLFDGIRENGYYEVGSDSKIAPSLESLMALYAKFIEVQNTAVNILAPVLNTGEELLIVNDWRDDLADASKYLSEIRKIPFLEGNTPNERLLAASTPQRINDTPIAKAAKIVTNADTAPVLPSHVVIPSQEEVEKVQPEQPTAPAPRYKLGTSAPTVSAQASHQLVGNAETGLTYQRAPTVPTPTPPVGTFLQQQQPQLSWQQQQEQLRLQQLQQHQLQLQQQAAQAMKVPETARLLNGHLYIPVSSTGVSAIPPGAVMIDNVPHVPMGGIGAAAMPVQPGNMGMMPNQQNRFGMPSQQQITDPSQVPGLSAAEIQMYRNNPVMFQNYLDQLQGHQQQQNSNVLMTRQNQIPRYLRERMEEAQQQQQYNNNGMNVMGRRY